MTPLQTQSSPSRKPSNHSVKLGRNPLKRLQQSPQGPAASLSSKPKDTKKTRRSTNDRKIRWPIWLAWLVPNSILTAIERWLH